MTNIKALDRLRAAGRNMAKGRNLENHEECNLLLVIADEIEAEIVERFVELPVDADGVLIHVGDVVQGLGDAGPVQHVELWDDGWVVVFEFAPGQFTRYSGDAVRHYKPRTIEDVLREFAEEVYASHADFISIDGENAYLLAAINETADEIRELTGVS